MSVLSHPRFNDEQAAYDWIEARLWPDGPVCPHCGTVGRAYALKGASTRIGVRKCAACRKPFTVKVGTIFEGSHIPLHKRLQAMHLMCSSKKGISSHQLHRLLGITLKSAWFLSHRIREDMRDDSPGGLGGLGKIVEADETYFGRQEEPRPRAGHLPPPTKGGKSGPAGKRPVVGLVERRGKVRTFHVSSANAAAVRVILRTNASRKSKLMTDESK